MQRHPVSLAEQHEILCQMLELAHQSNDTNLTIYTLHYASQYYRRIERYSDARDFLHQAVKICGDVHPLKNQLLNELAVLDSDASPDLNYWIFAKTGPLLFSHTPTRCFDLDEDLFGMFFSALQNFASELQPGDPESRIANIQWASGESFALFHRAEDPIFIVGLCDHDGLRTQVAESMRQVYYRFYFTFESELLRFQGNVESFQQFL